MIQLLLASVTIALVITCDAYQVNQTWLLRSHGRQISAMLISIRHETGKSS